ncbi:MAG TPA: hypothetical protein VMU54_02950 [Planctomycetota bacterium]|nr:hypothetical protein [Planctomycetota bacterium]
MPEPQDSPSTGRDLVYVQCTHSHETLGDAYPPILPPENEPLLTPEDRAIPSADRRAWSTLKQWQLRARLLHELSGCALRSGQALEAADFEEAADRLECWVACLFKLLLKRVRPPAAAD